MRMKEVCVVGLSLEAEWGKRKKDNTKTTNNGEIILIYSFSFLYIFGNGGTWWEFLTSYCTKTWDNSTSYYYYYY